MTTNRDYKKGDFFPVLRETNKNKEMDNSGLFKIYKFAQEEIENSDRKNRITPIPILLSGDKEEIEDYQYVRIEGTIGSHTYSIGNTIKGVDLISDNGEENYIISRTDMNTQLGSNSDSKLVYGKKYIFFGMTDNTLFPERDQDYKQKIVINALNYWAADEAENHKWNVGVYSENEDEGVCYISDPSASKDEDGIVWESVGDGQTLTIQAQPNKGYEFKCWVLNGKEISQEPSLSITAIGNVLYRAEFEKSEPIIEVKTIEINAPSADEGTLKINNRIINESQSLEIEENQEMTIEAIAAEGYEFDYWDLGDDKIVKDNPYTLIVTENLTITAHFKESIKYAEISVSVENQDEGMIRINSGVPSGGPVKEKSVVGELMTVEAIPSVGYLFSHWLVDGEKQIQENPYTFEVDNEMTMVAFFKKQEWIVSFKAGGNGSMSISTAEGDELTSGDKVTDGTEIIVTLEPEQRYMVDQLFVKRGDSEGANVPVVDNCYVTTVKSDININATFKPDINGYYDLKVSVEEKDGEILGKVYIDVPGTTSISAKYMDNHTFYAVPSEYCKFVGWKTAGDDYIRNPGTKQDEAYILEWNGNCDENLVAIFDYVMEYPRTVSVSVNSQTKGTARIEGETVNSIESRKPVKVIAETLTEYDYFENWTDGNNVIVSLEPEYTYEGEEDILLTANFYSKYPVKLSTVGKSETILEDEDGSQIANGTLIMEGAQIRLVGYSDETEELNEILINGSPVSVSDVEDLLDMTIIVKEPLNIEVVWQLRQYNLSVITSEGGSVLIYSDVTPEGSPSGNKIDPAKTISHGSVIHIFPVADDGFMLKSLSVNDIDRTADIQRDYLSHTLQSHVLIKADFEAIPSGIADNLYDEENSQVQIYDLRGIKINRSINELAPGIYIIKRGDQVKKIKVD